jgi:hypothetical protein
VRVSASNFADSHGSLELKVGLASGSVGCVLLGACRRFYCIYGTTVNLAARMSQHSAPDLIALPAGMPSDAACGQVGGGGAGLAGLGKSLLNLVQQDARGRGWGAGVQLSVALRKDAVMLKGLGLTEVCDVAVTLSLPSAAECRDVTPASHTHVTPASQRGGTSCGSPAQSGTRRDCRSSTRLHLLMSARSQSLGLSAGRGEREKQCLGYVCVCAYVCVCVSVCVCVCECVCV